MQSDKPQLREWFFWLVWLVGPASFGAAFVYCFLHPELCDSNPTIMLVLMVTHLVAAVGTLALLLRPGPRRRVECWLLLPVYWVGIAIWIFPAVFGIQPSLAPRAAVYSTLVSAAVVVLIPVVRVLRFMTGRR